MNHVDVSNGGVKSCGDRSVRQIRSGGYSRGLQCNEICNESLPRAASSSSVRVKTAQKIWGGFGIENGQRWAAGRPRMVQPKCRKRALSVGRAFLCDYTHFARTSHAA